jgi:tetratricopeptide (TPR) repeat protein
MSWTKSLLWLHRAVLFLLVWSVVCPQRLVKAQNGAEEEIRALIERYSAAYENKDLAGLTSLWSERSPELAAAKQTFQQMLIANSRIQINSLAVRKVTLEGDKATARIILEMSAIDAKTGKPAEGFGKKNRTMQLVKESCVWRVWRDVSSIEELAAAISAAKTDEERKALLEAEKELITVEHQTSLLNRADSIVTRGIHEGAMPLFQLALLIARDRGDKTGIATALRGIGKVHYLQGNAAKALEYFDQSLRISEELGDKQGFARTLNNIGNVHQSQARYKPALEYYERSLTISQETGDRLASGNTLNNIGVVRQEQGNYVQALEYYQKSLNTKEGIAHGVLTARTLNNMGGTYQSLGRYAQALERYEKSLTFSEEADDKNAVAKR